jgi:hypothetical protein
MASAQEFERLLDMDDAQLETAVVGAVSRDERLMAIGMPQTVPPMSVDDYLRNTSSGDLRNSVLEYIRRDFETTEKDLYELICVRLNYCEAKKTRADLIALLGTVVTHYVALVVVAGPHCWILAPAVVYLSKKYLDKLCKCK